MPLGTLPKPYDKNQLERYMLEWQKTNVTTNDNIPILEALFGNSPFLSGLLLRHPDILSDVMIQGADATHSRLMGNLSVDIAALSQSEFMQRLRIAKGRMALLVAIADITGAWTLAQVTAALSAFAEISLTHTLNMLLTQALKRKEIAPPHPDNPSKDSGIIVLGMGKLGGRELNYSSDIDLIILFEKDILGYKGRHNEQQFMNKLAHDLVHVMQERTADGYVFRTDLRLRPDPASTPPAINAEAAYYYYESVGQNWERAAMIKARPVVGDYIAGERFLKNIAPFMWRRSLDFAAIQDIHSIKRQMDSHQDKEIKIPGHNIKLGMGGIREIEFYSQIHQLIWGGKQPMLRTRGTCETLRKLEEMKLIDAKKRETLITSYEFYRKLEHRLQMVADEQTHDIPENEADITRIAYFMGYADAASFTQDTLRHLHAVHDIFSHSFQSSEKLGNEGNLVFTGVSHDPETLKTLRAMGYENPETVSEIVMGWHHGSKRATRTKRAREILTELMPTLLKRLAETASPDTAFLKFNDFLTHLPAGVQIFSLFNVNPQLLGLVADIMGSAPTLAEHLSKTPNLLDGVLYADFYKELPDYKLLHRQLLEIMPGDADYETAMDVLRRFRNEKQFQAGVHVLKHMISGKQAGYFLSDLADLVLQETYHVVAKEFARQYGMIAGSRFAIIALGRLGSKEITFGSDIDLVFIYDAKEGSQSDGHKPLGASQYYHRMTQRLLNSVTAMGRDGRLYEVDIRLRPSGDQGLLITSLQGMYKYFDESAWTFEYMAFTKSRVVAGDRTMAGQLESFILNQLAKHRDMNKLKSDVVDMRERIEQQFGTKNIWDIKYIRGGWIDVDFIAQYLLLLHAPDQGKAITGSADMIISWLKENGAVDETFAASFSECHHTLTQLFHVLRLSNDGLINEATALPGLRKLLCEALRMESFEALKERLITVEQTIRAHYAALLLTP